MSSNNNNQALLTVYRASAGSGKTYTLALRYIKLLFGASDNYRKILAVTFTNKATGEMKMRILSKLYGMAKGLKSGNDYKEDLKKALGLDDAAIQHKAQEALSALLHNYTYFRVQTIDAFFQTILRNLARELHLSPNWRVELNTEQVEQMAVDRMIDELKPGDALMDWLNQFIQSKTEDDKNWNVIKEIKAFGEDIFKDFYKQNHVRLEKALGNDDKAINVYLGNFRRELQDIINEAFITMQQYGVRFSDILNNNNLDYGHFKSKEKGICGYFIKLRNMDAKCKEKLFTSGFRTVTVENCLNESAAWLKTNPDQSVLEIVEQQLRPLLCEAENFRVANSKKVLSAQATIKNLYLIGLLKHIDQEVSSFIKEENLVVLGNTQYLLKEMINNNDAPFIYEKIGAHLRHIMIDEFQDTSRVQWENFKVLLLNCIASADSRNLIVGDIKQSIYRWRDGDWRLLVEVDKDPKLKKCCNTVPLNKNWRSEELIVRFNNAFFKRLASCEAQLLKDIKYYSHNEPGMLMDAYKDVSQDPHKNDGKGYVHFALLPDKGYDNAMCKLLADQIDALRSKGVSFRDMAILCRAKKDLVKLTEWFITNRSDIKLISNNAFLLESSVTVKIIILALRWLDDPSNRVVKTALAVLYQRIVKKQTAPLSLFVPVAIHDDPSKLDVLLPQFFIDQRGQIASLPLHDIVEEIFRLFELNRISGQEAFLCHFFDILDDFQTNYIADISTFLQRWDDDLHSKKTEGVIDDGIQMMTIHTSKGLEFDYVFIPYLGWKNEKSEDKWMSTEESPFNRLPFASVTYKKSLGETVYQEDYYEEHFQNVIDDLNMLYVAFTRAGKGLVCFGKSNPASNTRGYNVLKVLENSYTPYSEVTNAEAETDEKRTDNKSLGEILNENNPGCFKRTETVMQDDEAPAEKGAKQDKEDKIIVFECGSIENSVTSDTHEQEEDPDDNVFTKKEESEAITLCGNKPFSHFRQSNESDVLFSDDTDEAKKEANRQRGIIMHQVLSRIVTANDIARIMQKLEGEGILTPAIISKQEVEHLIRQCMNNEQIKDWFSDKWTVLTERALYDPQAGKTLRCDRVMIAGSHAIVVDFKMGNPSNEHHKQVREYMSQIQKMRYGQVDGFLLYLPHAEVVRV